MTHTPPKDQGRSILARAGEALQTLIAPHPSVKGIGEYRRAQLLSILTLILSALFAAVFLYGPSSYGAFLLLAGITVTSYFLSRTRYHRTGIYLFTFVFTAIGYVRIYQGAASSIESSIVSTVHIALVISSVLLSQRGFFALVALATLATFAAPLYSNIPPQPADNIGRAGGIVFVIGVLLHGINLFRAKLDNEQRRELSDANRELGSLAEHLEQRVEERTRELQESARQVEKRAARLQSISDISKEIAARAAEDPDQLLAHVTQEISERLGYYHSGIFLLDENREYAVLRAANSAGGKQMLARQHQLRIGGTGIVGYVSQSGFPRIALDTGADAVFFNNPDLPDTRSEISLPLKYGETVVGVLDVQSTEPSAFSDDDVNTLSTLANQIALIVANLQAAGNAPDAPRSKDGQTTLFARRKHPGGYSYQSDGSIVSSELPWTSPALEKTLASGGTVVLNSPSREFPPAMAVPVRLREQIIGAIHVESSDANRVWTEDEIAVVQAIADRAAFALENARLLEDATRRAEQEATIARVTTKIGSSSDFDRILQTTIRELGQALGASRSFIQIGTVDADGNREQA